MTKNKKSPKEKPHNITVLQDEHGELVVLVSARIQELRDKFIFPMSSPSLVAAEELAVLCRLASKI